MTLLDSSLKKTLYVSYSLLIISDRKRLQFGSQFVEAKASICIISTKYLNRFIYYTVIAFQRSNFRFKS